MEQIINFLLTIYTYDPLATVCIIFFAIFSYKKEWKIFDKIAPELSSKLGITGSIFWQNLLFVFFITPFISALFWVINKIFGVTGGIISVLWWLLQKAGEMYIISPILFIFIAIFLLVISYYLWKKSKYRLIGIIIFSFLVLNAILLPIVNYYIKK